MYISSHYLQVKIDLQPHYSSNKKKLEIISATIISRNPTNENHELFSPYTERRFDSQDLHPPDKVPLEKSILTAS